MYRQNGIGRHVEGITSHIAKAEIHISINKIINVVISSSFIKSRYKMACSLNRSKLHNLGNYHPSDALLPNVRVTTNTNRSIIQELRKLPCAVLMLTFKDHLEACSATSLVSIN